MQKAMAAVFIGFVACHLHVLEAQMLSSGAADTGRDPGGMLASQARALRSTLAARLTSPAIMEADEDESALPMQVAFEPGSARLTASATRALDHLGQALSNGPLAGDRIRIEGHADGRGSADARRDVAERRAAAVATYLQQNFSLNPSRLACVAAGSAPPTRRLVLIVRLGSS